MLDYHIPSDVSVEIVMWSPAIYITHRFYEVDQPGSNWWHCLVASWNTDSAMLNFYAITVKKENWENYFYSCTQKLTGMVESATLLTIRNLYQGPTKLGSAGSKDKEKRSYLLSSLSAERWTTWLCSAVHGGLPTW